MNDEAEEIMDDFFAFEAAARGPESRFFKSQRVRHVTSGEPGTVIDTMGPHRALDANLYPYKESTHFHNTWKHGAVRVSWDNLGATWLPTYSLKAL